MSAFKRLLAASGLKHPSPATTRSGIAFAQLGHAANGRRPPLERGKRVIVEDVEQSPVFVGTPGLEIQLKAGVRAVQSTPLVSRTGKPLGMFSTYYKKPHTLDERTLKLLDLLAGQAADMIEYARAEDSLRESEERFRVLAESMPQIVWTADATGASDYYNPRCLEYTGKSLSDLHGSNWTSIIHPDDLETTLAACRQTLETGFTRGSTGGVAPTGSSTGTWPVACHSEMREAR
jgi:PAS domain-containing protein